jgi:polyisoprenoid-binding protein YceI
LLAYSTLSDSSEEVNHVSIVAESSTAVIPTGTWSVDPVHSSVEFDVTHAGIATVKGRALVIAGTIRGGEEPSIEGTVDATSLTTFDDTRDAHLRTPDFFDAERYPELRFLSSSVEDRDGELVVTGDITIRGVTKPLELRGTFRGETLDAYGNERIGLDLAGTVDRTQFGVSWNAPLPGGGYLLPDEIPMFASFSAIKSS